MGQIVAKLLSSIIWGDKKLSILMLGLDNSGMEFFIQMLPSFLVFFGPQ